MWVNYHEALPLRCCCVTGNGDKVFLTTPGLMCQIPLLSYSICSNEDKNLYVQKDNGIQITEDGIYLISGSAYFVPGTDNSGLSRGLYIYATQKEQELGKEIASVQYHGTGYHEGAISIPPRVMAITKDTIIKLVGRGGNINFSEITPYIASNNLGTYLTLVKVG
jgi:hypothetical protein